MIPDSRGRASLASQAQKLRGSRDGRAALNLLAELLKGGWNVLSSDQEQNNQMQTALIVLDTFIMDAGQQSKLLQQLTATSMEHTRVFEEQKRKLESSTERIHDQQDDLVHLKRTLDDRQERLEKQQRLLSDIAKLVTRDPQLADRAKLATYDHAVVKMIREMLA